MSAVSSSAASGAGSDSWRWFSACSSLAAGQCSRWALAGGETQRRQQPLRRFFVERDRESGRVFVQRQRLIAPAQGVNLFANLRVHRRYSAALSKRKTSWHTSTSVAFSLLHSRLQRVSPPAFALGVNATTSPCSVWVPVSVITPLATFTPLT